MGKHRLAHHSHLVHHDELSNQHHKMTRTRRLALVAAVLIVTTTIIIIRTWSNIAHVPLQDFSAKNNTSLYEHYHYPRCAPWIPKKSRVIAFEKKSWMQTWHSYHHSRKVYHGGEAYWAASLDYALQMLGFRVERRKMDVSLLRDMRDDKIYKFIYNSNAPNNYPTSVKNHPLFQDPNITCRFHFLHWWAGDLVYNANGTSEQESYSPFPSDPTPELGFDARHALAPLPGSTNMPLYYFVHSQVTLPPMTTTLQQKPRDGFLLSKHCSFDVPIVRALLDAGFTLHTTCFDKKEQAKLQAALGTTLTGMLVHHSKMLPTDFSKLMRDMAFMVGFGNPPDSPSPYEALANGAAYLQIRCKCPSVCRMAIQHRSLRTLGFPYVYDYARDCNDTLTGENVVKAAEQAYQNPFPSYIPSQHTLGTVLGQVCSNLIESNAVCACAQLQERMGTDTEEKIQVIRNCRSGSFYEFPLD